MLREIDVPGRPLVKLPHLHLERIRISVEGVVFCAELGEIKVDDDVLASAGADRNVIYTFLFGSIHERNTAQLHINFDAI